MSWMMLPAGSQVSVLNFRHSEKTHYPEKTSGGRIYKLGDGSFGMGDEKNNGLKRAYLRLGEKGVLK